ncbi:helix-turn-helix domain-containing protein [Novosphingobium sp.]|uniref:TetR/AcrR family transcriptional regulator n=1 Tax=Novosphingobium sp. TaxID=1874826 RepID=UPI003D0AE6D2
MDLGEFDAAKFDAKFDDCLAAAFVRRGRPSVAEAEALSGRILDASWDVLLTAGFEGFTFDRVARHAHIGKATIYSRFPGKRELMRALLARRIVIRSDFFKSAGHDLAVEDAFCLRAANTMKGLFSPDGALMERLIDWLEQETGEGQPMRAQAYRDAIESIGESLADSCRLGARASNGVEPAFAARLWIEGLIGHAKLAHTEGASSPDEIERWAADYTRFYFAGLRAMVAG